MRKSFQLICMVFVFALICAGIGLMHSFPIDTQPYVKKKYSGWNGVLQAWICTDWNPDGSFIQWLNRCSSDFEKQHEGVYIEFTPVSSETLRSMDAGSLRLPDLVFFSPGLIENPEILTEIKTPDELRSDLKSYGSGCAVPVALSGYIWAYNIEASNTVPQESDGINAPLLAACENNPSFSAALLGLLSGTDKTNEREDMLPDPGIDLGLDAAAMNTDLSCDELPDLFINGKLNYIAADAKALGKLHRLDEDGRLPDWSTAITGEIACTDQILLAGIPKQEDAGRCILAEAFISHLFSENAQTKLADIGAFGVHGKRIHTDFSVYAGLDALLNSRTLWTPACFSEYSAQNPGGIIRRFLAKEISAKNALSLLGFEDM